MKGKLKVFVRGVMVLLAIGLLWTLWAGAQTNTNTTSVAATNRPSVLVRDVERWEAHPLTFGLDRVAPLRETKLLGEPVWKYLASLIYVLLAFYVSKLIDWVTRVWLRKLTARTETRLDDLLLGLLHGPVKVAVFVVLLNIGLSIFDWPPQARLYLSKGLVLVLAGALTYLAVKVLDALLDVWERRLAQGADRKLNELLFSFIRKSLNAFVLIVAVLVTGQNLGINMNALIASLSIGGLAVGLAAQDTLANLFGAVAVLMDRPFHVGDQIKLEGAEGVVESVGLRSTRVRHPEGHLVAVPNKTVGNAIIINMTKRAGIKTTMNLTLAHSTPTDKVKRALALLEEVYGHHPQTQQVWVSFNQFAGGNLNILIVHWWKGTDYQKYLAGMQEMNLAVKERFDAEGISFA